ncbi:glutamate-rich protein 2-like [Saccostrea cucullata]|uniref:glutamate-rich protein 2-like n=1 Tax=Saccostrea cuccullata TaxID=36930 RepID=UPI002ED33B8A
MSGPDRKTDPLPILGEDGAVYRQGGDQKRMPPPGANKPQSRRTPTPTKQVTLRSVGRRDDLPGYEEPVDMEELRQSLSRENSRIYEPREEKEIKGANSIRKGHSCSHGDGNKKPFVVSTNVSRPKQKPVNLKDSPKPKPKEELPPEGAEGGKEDSSSDSDSEEEEERKAPSQLLMEFLECLMKKEYVVAAKLCKMILIYEPTHPTALQFQPVLEEKILLDQEKENESGSDESGDEESDDSGEESDDDDDESESDSSENEEEEEEEEGEEERNSGDDFFDEFKHDSGIVSASSD